MITLYVMSVKRWGFSIPTVVAVLLLVGMLSLIRPKKIGAEMFPSPPQWMDLTPEGENTPVHYFEYKDKYCFEAHRGTVVSLQCGKL